MQRVPVSVKEVQAVYLYTDTYEGKHAEVPDVTGKSADFARQMLNAAGPTKNGSTGMSTCDTSMVMTRSSS